MAEACFVRRARYQNTRCRGDHQGGNLRDQAITNTQNGVCLHRLSHAHVALDDANADAADDVDQRDDNARDGIAANKLASTVHRTIKICFLRQLLAPRAGLIFLDETGVQLGVNRHLFARHGVQREPRRHFGNTTGTFGNDHEVNQRENDKHHEADHIIVLHDHFAKFLNDLARLRFAKDEPGRCYVNT